MPVLIDADAAANQPEQAFAKGSEFLSHNPDSLNVLVDLMSLGTDLAKKQNPKFLSQSLQYGAHAIELIEADKKPANMDDAAWKQYKTTVLPSVYQSMGLLNLVKGDQAEAKARFMKASELAPSDAFNFLMLAGMLNDEYQNEAKHFQSMPAGPAKNDPEYARHRHRCLCSCDCACGEQRKHATGTNAIPARPRSLLPLPPQQFDRRNAATDR